MPTKKVLDEPVEVTPKSPSPIRAAVYRAIAAFIALGLSVAILLAFRDMPPAVEVILVGLAGASALGIEEFIKSQQGL